VVPGELVAAAKSAGLSPKMVESYDELIQARESARSERISIEEAGRDCSRTGLLAFVASHLKLCVFRSGIRKELFFRG